MERIGSLEKNYANLQGRMWAISAVWAVIILMITVGARFIAR